ncbi:hypothetical protein LTR53_004420 [Teratosphaeriaceae sp. CCFEE 6253]|nr:hypothetical protein LTR53_004420 [Teratosphaeriaceae sp. CCFEE 6253]
MYESDPGVFAVLIPTGDRTKIAFGLDHNRSRFVRAAALDVASEPSIRSRDPTPAPDPSSSLGSTTLGRDLATVDHLVLRFSDQLTSPLQGVQVGSGVRSDILLGARGTKGVSARQGTITVDDNLRVFYTDSSTHGSSVGYGGQAIIEVRRRDRWILAYEPGKRAPWKNVEICVAIDITQLAAQPTYVANLRAFRERCSSAIPPVDALDLVDNAFPPTEPASHAHTPGNQAIYIDAGPLGKGAFGEVRRAIKARDGEVYAIKRFFPPKALAIIHQPAERGGGKRKRED